MEGGENLFQLYMQVVADLYLEGFTVDSDCKEAYNNSFFVYTLLKNPDPFQESVLVGISGTERVVVSAPSISSYSYAFRKYSTWKSSVLHLISPYFEHNSLLRGDFCGS